MLIAYVRMYTLAGKLTPWMLNEPIEQLAVCHAETMNGVAVQHLTINSHCAETMKMAQDLPLGEPKAFIHTRKGVAPTYEPNVAINLAKYKSQAERSMEIGKRRMVVLLKILRETQISL